MDKFLSGLAEIRVSLLEINTHINNGGILNAAEAPEIMRRVNEAINKCDAVRAKVLESQQAVAAEAVAISDVNTEVVNPQPGKVVDVAGSDGAGSSGAIDAVHALGSGSGSGSGSYSSQEALGGALGEGPLGDGGVSAGSGAAGEPGTESSVSGQASPAGSGESAAPGSLEMSDAPDRPRETQEITSADVGTLDLGPADATKPENSVSAPADAVAPENVTTEAPAASAANADSTSN